MSPEERRSLDKNLIQKLSEHRNQIEELAGADKNLRAQVNAFYFPMFPALTLLISKQPFINH